jgi:hypothetical protein
LESLRSTSVHSEGKVTTNQWRNSRQELEGPLGGQT